MKIFKSGMFSIPIIVLFFRENGLTMKEVLILQSLFSLVVLTLELPTGYFADKIGRKTSILIGGILATAGFAAYSLSYDFWGFLLAESILGIGFSFISGADSALLYETLKEQQREINYKKIQGKTDSIGMVSEAVTSVAGGFLALVSLRFPLYWDAVFNAFMIPLALTLVEPQRKSAEKSESNLLQMWKLIKFSLNDHKEIKWLIIYSAVIYASTLTMVWFIQIYWVATSVPLKLFGVLWAFLQLSAALFAWNAHSVEKFFGRKKSLMLLLVFPMAGYFLLGTLFSMWAGMFILFFYVTRGLSGPVLSDYINGLVSSDVRASILSVKNLVGRLIFSAVGPFAGWINDVVSLQAALFSSGLIFLVSGIVALLFLHKNKAL